MHEVKDERGIPISAGIPPIVVIAGIVGFIAILAVIAMVLGNSDFGHVWPSSNSTNLNLNT